MRDNKAILIIADSERDSNIYYATGFLAPDPFVYIKKDNEKIMVTSNLELDRDRSQSKVDKVFPLSKYEKIVKKRGNKASKFIELVITVLREINIKKLLVPANHQKQTTNTVRN